MCRTWGLRNDGIHKATVKETVTAVGFKVVGEVVVGGGGLSEARRRVWLVVGGVWRRSWVGPRSKPEGKKKSFLRRFPHELTVATGEKQQIHSSFGVRYEE